MGHPGLVNVYVTRTVPPSISPELDEIEPQLGVDHLAQRISDVFDCWHMRR